MGRTFVRQGTQIRKSDSYADSTAPSYNAYEVNTTTLEDDLNSLRSQIQNFLNRNGSSFPTGKWYDDISAPSTFEFGKSRGINEINKELHDLERKRVLSHFINLVDVDVPSGQNYVVLSFAALPTPSIPNPYLVARGGSSYLTGTIASSGSIGTHSLDNVPGSSAINPKNLCTIVSGSSRDPILSDGRTIYALFQTDKSDGGTLVGNDAQLSFVRINSSGDDLEAVPFADIEGKKINYTSVTRKALEDLNEQDFLRGAEVDVPAGVTVSRQVSYTNQGITPVDVLTNSVLDLQSSGISWQIRDNGEQTLFSVVEGTSGGNSSVIFGTDVDLFDSNAIVNDFNSGVRINTGGQRINIGETAGTIESTSTNDLRIFGSGELYLDDGNQTGSSWAQTSGIKLSDTTSEWSEFETAFGSEISIIKSIYQSKRKNKSYHMITTTIPANSDVSSSIAGSNIDNPLPDMSAGSFTVDYDIYLNGQLMRPGADSIADNDYYPGTTSTSLKFEFSLKQYDVICVVPYIRE
jgi:hypothetical protein